MDLIRYNSKYELPAFGLNNIGNLCYFNSMMQCVLSCTSFVETVITFGNSNNPVIKMLQQLIDVAFKTPNQAPVIGPKLWQTFITTLSSKNTKFGLSQEDSNEGLILFIDAIGVERIFEHRYRADITCHECSAVTHITDTGVFIEFDPMELKSQTLMSAIRTQTSTIDGYNCGKCGSKTPKSFRKSVTMLPEILVIVLKKYDKKTDVALPKELKFQTNLTYKLVGTGEHSGSTGGGHYWALVERASGIKINANDSSVTPISEVAATANTYMAYYQVL